MAKDSVAVRIAGHEYKIKSDGDPDSLREIAGYVDRAMARVRDRTGTVDSLDVAVLTCLNLAREILALHEERTPAGSIAIDESQLRGLIERVERSLGSGAPPVSATAEPAADVRQSNAGGSTVDSTSPQQGSKTLELPSVEAMRERSGATAQADDGNESSNVGLPEPRVASGGRDRAS